MGVGGREDPRLLEVPILAEVFPEGIGMEKHPHHRGHAVLRPQFLRTPCRIVGHVCAQRVEVRHHPVEAPARADALLLRILLVRHAVLAVELRPCAVDHDVVEMGPHEVAVQPGEVEGRPHPIGRQFGRVAPAHAPHLLHRVEAQRLLALLLAVYQAAVVIAWVFLCKVACHLRQRLVGSYAHAHRHSHPASDLPVQLLAPGLQVHSLQVLEIDEALVDGVAEVGRSLLLDDGDHAGRHLAIELIVGGEDRYLVLRKLLLELEKGCSRLHSQRLGLVAPGHHAAVVVGQYDHGFSLQVWTENPLTRDVAVVAVDDAVHVVDSFSLLFSPLFLAGLLFPLLGFLFPPGLLFPPRAYAFSKVLIRWTTTPHTSKWSSSLILKTG